MENYCLGEEQRGRNKDKDYGGQNVETLEKVKREWKTPNVEKELENNKKVKVGPWKRRRKRKEKKRR